MEGGIYKRNKHTYRHSSSSESGNRVVLELALVRLVHDMEPLRQLKGRPKRYPRQHQCRQSKIPYVITIIHYQSNCSYIEFLLLYSGTIFFICATVAIERSLLLMVMSSSTILLTTA